MEEFPKEIYKIRRDYGSIERFTEERKKNRRIYGKYKRITIGIFMDKQL